MRCSYCSLAETSLPQNGTLLTGTCGHQMCSECLQSQLKKSATGTFPCGRSECNAELTESEFSDKTVEDAHMEKTIEIRKGIMRDYNKMR